MTVFRRSVQYQTKQSHDLRIVSPDCASSPIGSLKTYRLLPYRHKVSANRTSERPRGHVFHSSPSRSHRNRFSTERFEFRSKERILFLLRPRAKCLKSIHQKYSTFPYHILDLIFSCSFSLCTC